MADKVFVVADKVADKAPQPKFIINIYVMLIYPILTNFEHRWSTKFLNVLLIRPRVPDRFIRPYQALSMGLVKS